jgi:hypothetical protein
MAEFEPTIPFGQPELMRASGFTRYLDEMAREAPEGAPSTRLSSLSPSLTQDLMRFEQGGREPDLLEVLAACVRHARAVTIHLRCRDRVLPLSIFPRERVAHCPLDLPALTEAQREPLPVLQVEPAVLRAPGHPLAALVGEAHMYQPLAPLMWAIALHGARSELLPELAGAAVYRLAPTFDRTALAIEGPLVAIIEQLRRDVASQREIASWPDMNRERATRLLNALYLQAGLIISRSHPAALGDSWFRSIRTTQ